MNPISVTRRSLLSGADAASLVALGSTISPALGSGVAAVEAPTDLRARFEAARAEFKAAAVALYPDITDWTENAGEAGVLMFANRPPKPVEFSGYGVYELDRGKTSPIAAVAASEGGGGYYWQLYWRDLEGNDRFMGPVRFIKARNLKIKRKIRSLA